MSRPKRMQVIHVNVLAEQAAWLKDAAGRHGQTESEVVRIALSMLKEAEENERADTSAEGAD